MNFSFGSPRDENGSHNKGSPQVSSYLETCRDQYACWSPKGGDSGLTKFRSWILLSDLRRIASTCAAQPGAGAPKGVPDGEQLLVRYPSSMLCLGLAFERGQNLVLLGNVFTQLVVAHALKLARIALS
jgi:hypothetical protein